MVKINNLGPKVFSIMLTVSLLSLLFLAGPVQAFVLGLTAFDTDVFVGEEVRFQAVADFDLNETRDINVFIIDLAGPISISCTFLPDGTKVSSCAGMDIDLVENTTTGYGYGSYLGGKLVYNITLQTGFVPAGVYDTELISVGNTVMSTPGPSITVTQQEVLLESCSVRAEDGEMMLNGVNHGENNKINFNIPKSGAASGQGSVTAQFDGIRFNYKFDVDEILSSNNGNSTILVDGSYRTQRDPEIGSTATIFLNKNDGLVSITADDFSIANSEVGFIQGC